MNKMIWHCLPDTDLSRQSSGFGSRSRRFARNKKMFLPHPRVKVSIVGSLHDREVACSASDRQGSNFESCVWRTVSSQSSHHPQEVLLAQFSLYVHKGGLKPDSFHFIFPDTEFEIRILTVCGRARYNSATEAPHNIESLRVRGGGTFCFFWNLKARVGFEPSTFDFSSRQL